MIGVIIAAALIALVQIAAGRSGNASPFSAAAGTAGLAFQEAAAAVVGGLRGAGTAALQLPRLAQTNQTLRYRNHELERENARLSELVAAYREQVALAPQLGQYARAVEARVIGFPPEYAIQSVTIDKGTKSGVARDDGVLAADGVVGRIAEAGPFTSKVTLITDFTSTIPALVARGRYWGIARGNETTVRLEYVSQDAPLRVGQLVVTGEARSFHSGAPIGTIVAIDRGVTTLYQTAVVKPAVNFSNLDRVAVIPK